MKKFILSALVVVFSVSAFAQGDIISSKSERENDYEQAALQLLATNQNSIQTVDRSGKAVNARPVINDAFSYIFEELEDVLSAFTLGGDDHENEYAGNIDNLNFDCNIQIAKCTLTINYNNSQPQASIEYNVEVRDGQPVAIKNNRVAVSNRR